jgi:D-glycero-D-manno-heptose 1,7-bisphosphate phosphatase
MQRALFLDRDGTLVHPSHYPSQPEQLCLYPNIAAELQALQRMGLLLIVITNQSGIARGYFTEADLQRMHDYLKAQFAAQAVFLDAIYHCPHHPDGVISELSFRCDCRKPQPGMLLRAASDHNIDLHHSWFVGDILDDVEAGNRAGCRTALVDLGTEQAPTHFLRCPTFVGRDTCHALRTIRTIEELQPDLDLLYRPASWQVIEADNKQAATTMPEEGACTR